MPERIPYVPSKEELAAYEEARYLTEVTGELHGLTTDQDDKPTPTKIPREYVEGGDGLPKRGKTHQYS